LRGSLAFLAAENEAASRPRPVQRQCRLEWQRRGGRAGEDWVIRTGVMVADEQGAVMPLYVFLRRQVTALVVLLSSPVSKPVSLVATDRMVKNLMAATLDVLEHPVEMPQNYAAVSATAMLFGNFCDACIAVVDVTFSGTKDVTLSFDAHTLGVIAPRYYSVKRAHIPGSVPCTDYYAVSAPDRPDRAWATSAEDGKLAPSVLWAVQNALNCSFPGSAAEGKTLMRQWLTGLGKRFIGACAERSITRAELAAIAANRLSTAS
jgi:hypothetical protein